MHRIKSCLEQFKAVLDGDKCHEVRVFDRNYQPGDDVALCEWNDYAEQFTGREALGHIGDITWPGTFGLPENLGCFTFHVTDSVHVDE